MIVTKISRFSLEIGLATTIIYKYTGSPPAPLRQMYIYILLLLRCSPISNENLLLRGSTLKTAAHIYDLFIYSISTNMCNFQSLSVFFLSISVLWVYLYSGCAIYTDRDTKMMQNFNASRPIKRSCVSSELNKYMALLVVMLLVMTLMCLFGSMWYEAIKATHWYVLVSTIADIVVDRLTTFMLLLINLFETSELELFLVFEFIIYIRTKYK